MRADAPAASVALLRAVCDIVDAVRAAEVAGPAVVARLRKNAADPVERVRLLKRMAVDTARVGALPEGSSRTRDSASRPRRKVEVGSSQRARSLKDDVGPARELQPAQTGTAPAGHPHVVDATQDVPNSGRLPTRSPALPVLPPAIEPSELEGQIHTRFGGVSLLLRDLDERPWDAWTAGWPASAAVAPSILLKWMTAALCLGREQALDVLGDPAWRHLLGIPVDITTLDIARWLRHVGAARRRVLARATAIEASPIVLAEHERAWLTFPRGAGISAPWCGTLARIAHIVLRRFAHRLPGFADSTSDYLWRNFLAFDAAIELEEDGAIVKCGRPPLHLVLTLTGMTRGLMAGRDAYNRPILVFPGD
jgi:hypothetical protein